MAISMARFGCVQRTDDENLIEIRGYAQRLRTAANNKEDRPSFITILLTHFILFAAEFALCLNRMKVLIIIRSQPFERDKTALFPCSLPQEIISQTATCTLQWSS